jgi:hypothetical protein
MNSTNTGVSLYYELKADIGGGKAIRVLKPDAYIAHYEIIDGESLASARTKALARLSDLLPDGLDGFAMDIRAKKKGKNRTTVEITCIKEETYRSASDDGKKRLFTIESLLSGEGNASSLVVSEGVTVFMSWADGSINRRALVQSEVGSTLERIRTRLGLDDSQSLAIFRLDDAAEGAAFPETLKKPIARRAFKRSNGSAITRSKKLLLVSAVLLPILLFSAVAALKVDAYRKRLDHLRGAYETFIEEAATFSKAEKAIKDMNAKKLLNKGLKKILASCLEGFADNGGILVSFSFDGNNFRATGQGGDSLGILKYMAKDGSMSDLRLVDTDNGKRKNAYTITGKLSR